MCLSPRWTFDDVTKNRIASLVTKLTQPKTEDSGTKRQTPEKLANDALPVSDFKLGSETLVPKNYKSKAISKQKVKEYFMAYIDRKPHLCALLMANRSAAKESRERQTRLELEKQALLLRL